ncbi:MAG: CotH kinase family protein, partial [candidate division KSB1 bacterium]|nr:CotH kinase family protein [candidate division KSB1 bacterium]
MKTYSIYLILIISAFSASAQSKKLTFDPPRGFYENPLDVTITSPVEGATIKYTFNGEDPLTSKTALSAKSPAVVHIDPRNTTNRDRAPGVCVRAIAVLNNQPVTNMVTHTYLFAKLVTELSPDGQRPGPKWPAHGSSVNGQLMDYGMDPSVYTNSRYRNKMEAALLDIPSMSMVMDLEDLFNPATGIFVNAIQRGEEWERPCSLELLNPDGSDGFHINCGVRIRGGYSRVGTNRKHAFRYFFRKEYGEGTLNHPLFENEGVDKFDQIDLATSQNYSWAYGAGSKDGGAERNTLLRDLFSRDLQRDMGQPYTRSRYYHLYINGTYWGLFYTQERSEADFAARYFGGNPEDYDAIKVDAGYGRPYVIEAANGNLDAWNALWALAKKGFSDNAAYFRVQGLNPDGTRNPSYPKYLDVDNLIDYMINTYFVGDFDAPISEFLGNVRPNNFWAIYNRVNPDGFKFFRHDAEHILFNVNEDRTGPYTAGEQREHFNPQWLHQQLTANAEYRLRFADRVYKHFFNDGPLTPERNIERLLYRKEQIDNA